MNRLSVTNVSQLFQRMSKQQRRDRPTGQISGHSLNGLKTLTPGRLRSRSFPVTTVRLCRRA